MVSSHTAESEALCSKCISKAEVRVGQQGTMQLRDACSQCCSETAGVWGSHMIISVVSGCEDVLMLCHVSSQNHNGNLPNMSANKLQRSSGQALTHNARASRTSCSQATCIQRQNGMWQLRCTLHTNNCRQDLGKAKTWQACCPSCSCWCGPYNAAQK